MGFTSTMEAVLKLCGEYPSGITQTIIASEIQQHSQSCQDSPFHSYKITKISDGPTVTVSLENEVSKCTMILHSKYFSVVSMLQDATIRWNSSIEYVNRMLPTEFFILPSMDVSWLFPSLFEDIEPESLQHNLVVKIIAKEEQQGRVDVTVCDSMGAKGMLFMYGKQCDLSSLFEIVSYN
jgi:Cell division control protein 24, OB domain 1